MPAAANTPDPESFDVDAFLREAAFVPFKITLGGKERELPNFGRLSLEQMDRIDAGDVRPVLTDVCGKELTDLLAVMPNKAFKEITKRWQLAAEDEPGEDKASSDS